MMRSRLRRSALPLLCAALFASLSGTLGAQKAPNPIVVIETTLGDITIELLPSQAPKTVENFLEYVNSGFYGGTIFHRIVSGVMIQGGGLTPQLQRKPTRPPIKNEANEAIKNNRGTVAAARLAGVDTATAQFFINTGQNPSFDHTGFLPEQFGYAVFGRVVAGMDVVDKIDKLQVDARGVPKTLVMIKRAYVKEAQ